MRCASSPTWTPHAARCTASWYAQGVLLLIRRQPQNRSRSDRGVRSTRARPTAFHGPSSAHPGTFNDFVDSVVPQLHRRGLFPPEYTATLARPSRPERPRPSTRRNAPRVSGALKSAPWELVIIGDVKERALSSCASTTSNCRCARLRPGLCSPPRSASSGHRDVSAPWCSSDTVTPPGCATDGLAVDDLRSQALLAALVGTTIELYYFSSSTHAASPWSSTTHSSRWGGGGPRLRSWAHCYPSPHSRVGFVVDRWRLRVRPLLGSRIRPQAHPPGMTMALMGRVTALRAHFRPRHLSVLAPVLLLVLPRRAVRTRRHGRRGCCFGPGSTVHGLPRPVRQPPRPQLCLALGLALGTGVFALLQAAAAPRTSTPMGGEWRVPTHVVAGWRGSAVRLKPPETQLLIGSRSRRAFGNADREFFGRRH